MTFLLKQQKLILIQEYINENKCNNINHDIIHIIFEYYNNSHLIMSLKRDKLCSLLLNRKSKANVAELGYIDDSGMAPSIQATALQLNIKLCNRKSKIWLQKMGILDIPFEITLERITLDW